MSETTTAKAADRPNRSKKKRTPLGARNRLTFKRLDPNYVYRVINDTDDRLARAQEAGYEFVQSKESLGDTKAAEATKVGSNVSKPVGAGTTGFLMRIPKEYHAEDQQTKQDSIAESEKAMKPDTNQDQYGSGLTTD